MLPHLDARVSTHHASRVAVPWRLALQDDGWFLRSDVIWHKPNAMPESALGPPHPLP
jgi:hypothetical protein